MPILALLKLVPLKGWLILIAAVLLADWYWRQTNVAYEKGKTETTVQIQKGQIDAQERANTELRKLDRGDDSSMRKFDRD
ncbi:MAG TPA: hypothetical protein VIU82_25965 [Bosea sp. (in: a-proteobacteria)]